MWLIGWRFPQAIGGSMLIANSAAILTDAWPAEQRGFALGTNQIAGLAGQFVGLVAGGLLAAIDWRLVFWVNVPVGVFGTLWAYLRLKEMGERHRARMDWWGNLTFAAGLGAVLVGVTVGIQPYHGHAMGWTSPTVIGLLAGGLLLLIAFGVIESRIAEPMFQLSLFRIRAFTAGSIAGLVMAIARGGQQFMLIIWLQGIWLPLHGYAFSQTPLWAGIFLLPLTAGFLASGPVAGILSDRFGSRGIATAGAAVAGASFIGLMLLPVSFPFWAFALIIAVNGIGNGMFGAPNSSSIMGSVPARHRGAASGMRSTFQNSGTALSIGVFFSLMIAGLAASLPKTMTRGLEQYGVPHAVAHQIGSLPPVSSLFATVLGVNPVQHLLAQAHALSSLPAASQRVLTGREFFPRSSRRRSTTAWSWCSWRPPRWRRWQPSHPCCAAAALSRRTLDPGRRPRRPPKARWCPPKARRPRPYRTAGRGRAPPGLARKRPTRIPQERRDSDLCFGGGRERDRHGGNRG